MFCPNCGTKNPDNGKFCRKCGTDIGVVGSALAGKIDPKTAAAAAAPEADSKKQKAPDDMFAEGIKEICGGIGFVAVALVLFFTGMIGGRVWWFWLLIPAGFMIGGGIANMWKAKRMEKRPAVNAAPANILSRPEEKAALPPTRTDYVPPSTGYQTGDLVPPSVTETTTRHLTMDSEGETMTLPKK